MTTVFPTRDAGTSHAPNPAEFPAKGSVEDAIRFCLGYAVLAPSGHNSQPWWFKVDDNTVTVGLDISRGLAVADPQDREAIISVGAAVLTLRVALAHFGLASRVDYWPDPLDPEACARVTALYGAPVEIDLERLFDQIPLRHTSRHAFNSNEVDPILVDTIASAAVAEGTVVHVFTDGSDRERIAQIVSGADELQMGDPRFRRELASWLRHPGSRQADGIHGFATGSPLKEVALDAPLIVRTFDTGQQRGARDGELAYASPAMIVIATEDDDRTSWLRAGQALARLQLSATVAGLSVGFLDQPIEIPKTRDVLAEMLSDDTVPQLLLRLGYGPQSSPQPRRPLERSLLGG